MKQGAKVSDAHVPDARREESAIWGVGAAGIVVFQLTEMKLPDAIWSGLAMGTCALFIILERMRYSSLKTIEISASFFVVVGVVGQWEFGMALAAICFACAPSKQAPKKHVNPSKPPLSLPTMDVFLLPASGAMVFIYLVLPKQAPIFGGLLGGFLLCYFALLHFNNPAHISPQSSRKPWGMSTAHLPLAGMLYLVLRLDGGALSEEGRFLLSAVPLLFLTVEIRSLLSSREHDHKRQEEANHVLLETTLRQEEELVTQRKEIQDISISSIPIASILRPIQKLFHSIKAPSFFLDDNGHITDANLAAVHSSGLSISDLVGDSIEDLAFHPLRFHTNRAQGGGLYQPQGEVALDIGFPLQSNLQRIVVLKTANPMRAIDNVIEHLINDTGSPTVVLNSFLQVLQINPSMALWLGRQARKGALVYDEMSGILEENTLRLLLEDALPSASSQQIDIQKKGARTFLGPLHLEHLTGTYRVHAQLIPGGQNDDGEDDGRILLYFETAAVEMEQAYPQSGRSAE